MKEQKILAMILSCLVASVTVGSVAYACAPSKQFNQNFTLTATGQAYDPSSGYVAIQLSLSGTAKGHLDKIVELHVQGGTLSIEGYGTFTISKGEGIVIQRHRYIHLVFKVTPPYGGRCAQWITFGATGDLNGNTLPIPMLYSRGTLVPTTEHPRLYSMVLSGAITGLS
jgi:hypothetical protein